jgi:peptide/nickel transport system substrate-binding protein
LKTNAAGSGAFKLRQWKPNELVMLEANPDYRHGAPAMKRVVVQHVPEPAAQRLLLEKGDVDLARNLSSDQIEGIANNTDLVVDAYAKADIKYIGLNQTDERLANPKVRQAMRWLIDYQGMTDSLLKGRFQVHQAFWPAGLDASLTETPYRLDVERAKQLLAEAGYPDGFEVDFDISNKSPFSEIAQSVQATMAQGGIKVNILASEEKQVLTKYRARQHQMVMSGWAADYMDPHGNADTFARNPDPSENATAKTVAWRNSWVIPELTKEVDAAARELDSEKRRAMYLDLQKKVQEDSPFIIMFQQTEQVARRKNVEGFVSGATFDTAYYRLVRK